MSPVLFFVGLCIAGGGASIAMGRHFPECLFQPLIRCVLYIVGIGLVAVGIYVGVIAHLTDSF